MITMKNVTKRFDGTGAAAVDDLSLDIPDGITVALVGPSGCGKTTTMRMINRLIEPTSGTITVGGSDVRGNDATLYVDASAQYNLNENIKLILEVQNITDEQNRLFIDSTRKDTLFETRVGRTISFGAQARF